MQNKTVRDVLSGLALMALTLIITNLIQVRLLTAPLQWVIAVAVGLISVILLTLIPKGATTRFFAKLKRPPRRLGGRPDGHVLSQVFDFDGDPVQVVYTCRAPIDKAPCPQSVTSDKRLQHAICQHTPVDEFLTLHLMVHRYKDQIRVVGHEKLTQRFQCTFPLDELGRPSLDAGCNRAGLPEFMFDNLIVIGENSCSTLILNQLKQVLNFYPQLLGFAEDPFRPGAKPSPPLKPKIDLIFTPNNGNEIDPGDRFRIQTNFSEDNPNAVAMVCYAPNPFNLQKNVLIFYGCHRVGQYLLEEWLYSPESDAALRRMFRGRADDAPPWGQIALYAPFSSPCRADEDFKFKEIRAARNKARRSFYFPFGLPSERITTAGFAADAGVIQQGALVDISLIVELSKQDQGLAGAVDGFLREKLPFLHGHYWESQVQQIGLHVTLYEFATHPSHDTLAEGIELFTQLEGGLAQRLAAVHPPQMSMTGCEVFPSAIVLYADLPAAFLDAVREACDGLLPETAYFNRRRVPFPVHCTAVRFGKGFTKEEQQQLRGFAAAHHKQVFGEFQVQRLSLLLTRKKPYQDVERRFDLELAA